MKAWPRGVVRGSIMSKPFPIRPPDSQADARGDHAAGADQQRPPARAARAMPRGHLATFTSKVTLFAPPELRTSSLNFPSLAGVNFNSHFGPGLVSLPTTFLFSS